MKHNVNIVSLLRVILLIVLLALLFIVLLVVLVIVVLVIISYSFTITCIIINILILSCDPGLARAGVGVARHVSGFSRGAGPAGGR